MNASDSSSQTVKRTLRACGLLAIFIALFTLPARAEYAEQTAAGTATSAEVLPTCGRFGARLEGLDKGSTTWQPTNVSGWAELEKVPLRVRVCGGRRRAK